MLKVPHGWWTDKPLRWNGRLEELQLSRDLDSFRILVDSNGRRCWWILCSFPNHRSNMHATA